MSWSACCCSGTIQGKQSLAIVCISKHASLQHWVLFAPPSMLHYSTQFMYHTRRLVQLQSTIFFSEWSNLDAFYGNNTWHMLLVSVWRALWALREGQTAIRQETNLQQADRRSWNASQVLRGTIEQSDSLSSLIDWAWSNLPELPALQSQGCLNVCLYLQFCALKCSQQHAQVNCNVIVSYLFWWVLNARLDIESYTHNYSNSWGPHHTILISVSWRNWGQENEVW